MGGGLDGEASPYGLAGGGVFLDAEFVDCGEDDVIVGIGMLIDGMVVVVESGVIESLNGVQLRLFQ